MFKKPWLLNYENNYMRRQKNKSDLRRIWSLDREFGFFTEAGCAIVGFEKKSGLSSLRWISAIKGTLSNRALD
jgi:hypothetical protein